MGTKVSSSEHLVPRVGNFPVTNAIYSRAAVVTEMNTPLPTRTKEVPDWAPLGEPWTSGHTSSVSAIAVSPDSHMIATGDIDGNVALWNPRDRKRSKTLLQNSSHEITSLAFHENGNWLAVANQKGTLWVFDTKNGDPVLGPLKKQTDTTTPVYFVSDYVVTAPRDGSFQLVAVDSGPMLETEPWLDAQNGSFIHAKFVAGSAQLIMALGQKDGHVRFLAGEGLENSISEEPTHPLGALALERNGMYAASGSAEGFVKFFDPFSGRISLQTQYVAGPVMGMVFDPKHPTLFVATRTPIVEVMTLGSGDVYRTELQTSAACQSIAISDNGKILAAGCVDGSVQIWFDESHSITKPMVPKPSGITNDHARPAVGVMLTHEQSWAMQGIALGELLYGTSLAPGEVTQVAVKNHTQRVMQSSVNTASQQENLDQQTRSDSSLSEQEEADASEFGFGFSTASSSSSSRQIGSGVFAGLLGITGGSATSHSHAQNASFSMGNRNVSDDAQQKLHQSSHEQASQSRNRYAASVEEVSESEALELKTRVVANYNHMHALNLQFYEVVQVFRLRTRVVDAQRLIFFPMKVLGFTPKETHDVLSRFPHQIAAVLRELGHHAAAEYVDLVYSTGSVTTDKLRQQRIRRVWSETNRITTDYKTVFDDYKKAHDQMQIAEDSVLKDRDSLRDLKKEQSDSVLYKRNALQRTLKADERHAETTRENFKRIGATLVDLRRQYYALHHATTELVHFMTKAIGHPPALDMEAETNESSRPPLLNKTIVNLMLEQIAEILKTNRSEVNQYLWMSINPATYAAHLQGKRFRDQSIAAHVDPNPVAVAGHFVGFHWHHDSEEDERAFQEQYVNSVPDLRDTIALPTGGVFGEAVLGESNVADDIDISRFWNWKDSLPPISPAAIDPLQQPTPADLQAPDQADVQQSALNLGAINFPEVQSGIPNIIDALKNPELFTDLSGQKTSAALATSALDLSSKQATEASKIATENFKRHLQLQQKIADTVLDKVSQRSSSDLDPTMAGAVLNAGDGQGGRRTDSQSDGKGNTGSGSGDDDDSVRFVVEDPLENLPGDDDDKDEEGAGNA